MVLLGSRVIELQLVNMRVCAFRLSSFSHVRLFATLQAVARQAPLSMGFPTKNTRVGCHVLLQGSLSDPGMEPTSLMSLKL